MGDDLAHQELPVPGEEDALLVRGQTRQGRIPQVVVPEGVEAQQAQAPSQGTEMGIGEKARTPQGLRSQAQQGSHVEGLEHGVDRETVALPYRGIESDGLGVPQDQLHLGVRYMQVSIRWRAGAGGWKARTQSRWRRSGGRKSFSSA